MGREARCTVRYQGRASTGRALLETAEVVFRGDFRFALPFADLTGVDVVDGALELTSPTGTAAFELGEAEARKWAERILHPPTLMDKLGIRPGVRVAVLGVDDAAFWTDLQASTDAVTDGGPPAGGGVDVVVWGVDDAAELAGITAVQEWIEPAGALWAVWRKGRPELTENHVRDAALAAGLVDVKVARFSDSHSALKLVIPKARRPPR